MLHAVCCKVLAGLLYLLYYQFNDKYIEVKRLDTNDKKREEHQNRRTVKARREILSNLLSIIRNKNN